MEQIGEQPGSYLVNVGLNAPSAEDRTPGEYRLTPFYPFLRLTLRNSAFVSDG
jgi:hypothetical protein